MNSDLRPAPTPFWSSYPVVGLLAVLVSGPIAALFVPIEYAPAGALFIPAMILTVGLLGVVVFSTIRTPVALFRVEHLIMIGLVYWILLDLLQVTYDLKNVGRSAVQAAFVAIALFASGVWLASLHPPWPLPRVVLQTARFEMTPVPYLGSPSFARRRPVPIRLAVRIRSVPDVL